MEKLKNINLWQGLLHKLFVSVDAIVGLEFLSATLANQHIANVRPNIVLVRCCQ